MRHPHNNVADAGPGVEPRAQGVQRAIIRRHRAPGEQRIGVGRVGRACVYSMTLSAWSKSVCGIVRPNAFAVLRLMTSSNVVGRWMGRSAGFAPLRILSTYTAARREESVRLDA